MPSICEEKHNDGLIVGDEECDTGYISEACTDGEINEGWKCKGEPSLCEEIHDDGLIVGEEECDTGDVSGACLDGKIV